MLLVIWEGVFIFSEGEGMIIISGRCIYMHATNIYIYIESIYVM